MRDLDARRDPDRLAEVACGSSGELFELLGGECCRLETLVHEREVRLQDRLEDAPFFHGQVEPIQAFQGRLTACSKDAHRAMPRLVGGVAEVRGHNLINGHAAVRNRFGKLIDDGHRRGDRRFLPGAIEDHPAAALAEKGQDDRHSVTHVPLVLGQRALVDVHHRRVERQHVLLGDRALSGRLAFGNNDFQEIRYVAAVRRQTGENNDEECQAEATIDARCPSRNALGELVHSHGNDISGSTTVRSGKTTAALNSPGRGIGLEHPERVPIRVDEITVPAYAGHGELR